MQQRSEIEVNDLQEDRFDRSHAEFLRLLQQSYRSIFARVVALVPHREDAEDVMQEVMIVLWRRFDDYDRERPFSSWAYGVAYNTAKHYLRKRQHAGKTYFSDALIDQLVAQRTANTELFELRQEHLAYCLGLLKEADQQLLAECYAEGTRMTEIAKSRRQSADSIYAKLLRLRRRLYDCVSQRLRGDRL